MDNHPAWMRYLFIGIFVVPALLVLVDAGRVIREYIWEDADPNLIHFSSRQDTLLSEAAKVLIPTIAGFATLAVSGLGFLQRNEKTKSAPMQIAILAVCISIVIALAFWVFALAVSIDCGYPFDQFGSNLQPQSHPPLLPQKGPFAADSLNDSWARGLASAKLGTLSFFISIELVAVTAIGALTGLFDLRRRPNERTDVS